MALTDKFNEEWNGFKGRLWKEEVNTRQFIQDNYKPYDGDESFLAGPTEATNKLWGKLQKLQKEERAKGGVLECETKVVSGLTAYGPGYIDEEMKDLEKVVGLQTDKPLKRAFMPYGGIKMAEQAAATYGYEPDEKLHEIFTKYHKTHNQAVFDVYTPEIKKARHNKVITGLPDTYGRGRIVGDYRRVALYGIDFLIEQKVNDFTCKLSVLNFYNPEKNEYAYRLDGLDHTWQYTTDRSNIISYSNLESGTYTLYIKGTNGNGKWSKVEKALTIIITPPWWNSMWAYIAYAIFLIAVIAYTIHFIRKRIRLKNTLRIKEVEQRKQEELNRAKLQFFTNITHELLTPLTIISVTLNEIKSIAPQISDYYSIMDNNINRLKRLLQQILEFRKAESGNLKLKVSQGNIASFIRKSVDSFLPLLRNKKMQLDISIEQEEIIGYFDPDKVDKILYNLLSNAFKYNREGKTIRVNVSYGSSKREIIISVSDNGEGISKENLSKLFNRFYEGDYRKYHTTGHGIGLSLTKELAVLHHGKIEVESQINEGTTFRVTLPIIEEEFTEEEIDRSILPLPETVSDSLSVISSLNKEETIEITEKIDKKKLLLVEDNEDLLKVMADSLSREYHIIKATNGKEAIEQLEKTKDIVVVISDVIMPVMNGIELCHYMKKQDEWLHIPIILLTAKSSESDIIEGYEAGADDYITKPFQLTLLLVKIKSLLKNKENLLKNYSNIIAFEMQKPNIDSADKEFLQQAINCVYEHLDDIKFDQQAFADAMRVSKSTLYRKLKSLSNEGPSVFISDIRLQTAYKILSDNPSMRISDLAYTVGYNDPKYFSSCFKKKFKVLPRDISQE